MHRIIATAIVLLTFSHICAGCWTGGLTPELCCDRALGPKGNPSCWDAEYTYERCCGDPDAPPKASDSVESLKIAPGDVHALPLLGGGHMPLTGMGLCCRQSATGDAVRQGVLDYLLMGGRHLDDAQIYNNHREVGEGVRQAVALGVPRSEIFLTTKIWPSNFGFEKAAAWVGSMLGELGLEYVDLVLLHKPGIDAVGDRLDCHEPKACRQETWLALQRAQRAGQIRHLGVSNFGPRQMQELIALGGAPIVANQIEYHPWVPELHRTTAEWCHQHGIAVTAYGSMGSTGMASQVLTQDVLQQLGGAYGKTAGQVLLRWAVQKNVSVIPGTSNPKHMAENLRVFDFALADEHMQMLDGVPEEQRMLHFGHNPDVSP